MTSPSPTDCMTPIEQANPAPWVLTGGCQLVGDPDDGGQHNLYVGEVRIEGPGAKE